MWVEGRGWTDAGYLQPGMELLTHTGDTITITSISRRSEPGMVYNFSVQDLEAYFAGEDGVLVHNANCWGRRGGPAHVQKVTDIANNLTKKGWKVIHGGGGPEKRYFTPGGFRFPDIVAKRNGKTIAVQVGKRNKNGTPIAREVRALADLRASGHFHHVGFTGY